MVYYTNGLFCVEYYLFYEDGKRLGYFEDEEKDVDKIRISNHKATVDRLNELRQLNIELKRDNRKLRKELKKIRGEK